MAEYLNHTSKAFVNTNWSYTNTEKLAQAYEITSPGATQRYCSFSLWISGENVNVNTIHILSGLEMIAFVSWKDFTHVAVERLHCHLLPCFKG